MRGKIGDSKNGNVCMQASLTSGDMPDGRIDHAIVCLQLGTSNV